MDNRLWNPYKRLRVYKHAYMAALTDAEVREIADDFVDGFAVTAFS